MRAGQASTYVSSHSQIASSVVESDTIKDGAIVNTDVSATAAITFNKLDSTAVNSDLIPDVNASRYCGTGAKAWLAGYFSTADIGYMLNSLDPNTTGMQVIGTAAKTWKEIYVNDIKGDARGLILAFGLLG